MKLILPEWNFINIHDQSRSKSICILNGYEWVGTYIHKYYICRTIVHALYIWSERKIDRYNNKQNTVGMYKLKYNNTKSVPMNV